MCMLISCFKYKIYTYGYESNVVPEQIYSNFDGETMNHSFENAQMSKYFELKGKMLEHGSSTFAHPTQNWKRNIQFFYFFFCSMKPFAERTLQTE